MRCITSAIYLKTRTHVTWYIYSFYLDQRVRQCAKVLDDTILNAKLQQGLVITQDALYHRKCRLDLYRKANDKQQGYYTDVQRQLHGIAFYEIISFIEEEFNTSWEFVRLFKLTDINKVFCETLESLGLQVEDRIHGTRLKQ